MAPTENDNSKGTTETVDNPTGTGTTNPPVEDDKGKDAAQAAVDTAYAKLRDAEAERDKLRAQVRDAERAGLSEVEKLKQELEDSRLEAAGLQEQLNSAEVERTAESVAKSLGFRKPEKAIKFIDPESNDEKSIKRDLKEVLEEYPELAGKTGGPPPPVNSEKGGGSSGSRMNEIIRGAAGR